MGPCFVSPVSDLAGLGSVANRHVAFRDMTSRLMTCRRTTWRDASRAKRRAGGVFWGAKGSFLKKRPGAGKGTTEVHMANVTGGEWSTESACEEKLVGARPFIPHDNCALRENRLD